jgi:hypothetical protein
MRKLIAAIALSGSVAGCSVASFVGEQTGADAITDDTLRQKAAHTLGVNAKSVTVSERVSQGVETRFTAKTAGKSHACYVTSAYLFPSGRSVSDAVCSRGGKPAGAKTDSQSCNALLRAAGRCN